MHTRAHLTVVVSAALGGGASANGGGGADALSDLGDTSATVLPIDYVLALMVLFGLTVAERTVCVRMCVCAFWVLKTSLEQGAC